VADLKSAGPNRPFPYPGEMSVTATSSTNDYFRPGPLALSV